MSTHSLAMIATAIGLASVSRNQANGSLSVNLTVYLSIASTLSSEPSMYALALPLVVRKRSTL